LARENCSSGSPSRYSTIDVARWNELIIQDERAAEENAATQRVKEKRKAVNPAA
jgi:hypothetical protein